MSFHSEERSQGQVAFFSFFLCLFQNSYNQYLLKEKQVCIQNLQQEEEKMCNAIPKKIQDIKNNFFP